MRAGIEWLRPRRFVIPGTEVPALLPVYILLFVAFITTAAVRRSLSKKREVYKIRREEERKRAALLHEDVHSFENVTEEIMGTASEAANEKSEENEVSEDAEENQEPEEKTAAGYAAEKKIIQRKLKRRWKCRRKLNGMISSRTDLPGSLKISRKLDRLIEKYHSI